MSNPNRSSAMKGLRAFTVIELVTIVAVSGLVVGLLLPSLAMEKRIATRAACAQNERQLALAWHLFAADHNGKVAIDVPTGGNFYLWNMALTTRDNLVNEYKVPRKVFYCPSNPGQNVDALWTCPACGGS